MDSAWRRERNRLDFPCALSPCRYSGMTSPYCVAWRYTANCISVAFYQWPQVVQSTGSRGRLLSTFGWFVATDVWGALVRERTIVLLGEPLRIRIGFVGVVLRGRWSRRALRFRRAGEVSWLRSGRWAVPVKHRRHRGRERTAGETNHGYSRQCCRKEGSPDIHTLSLLRVPLID